MLTFQITHTLTPMILKVWESHDFTVHTTLLLNYLISLIDLISEIPKHSVPGVSKTGIYNCYQAWFIHSYMHSLTFFLSLCFSHERRHFGVIDKVFRDRLLLGSTRPGELQGTMSSVVFFRDNVGQLYSKAFAGVNF